MPPFWLRVQLDKSCAWVSVSTDVNDRNWYYLSLGYDLHTSQHWQHYGGISLEFLYLEKHPFFFGCATIYISTQQAMQPYHRNIVEIITRPNKRMKYKQ